MKYIPQEEKQFCKVYFKNENLLLNMGRVKYLLVMNPQKNLEYF